QSYGLYHFSITPDEILPYSQKLDAAVRSSPLSIPFPVSVVQSFLVTLPEHWQVKGEIVSVDNPAFRYGSDLRIEKNQLRVRYSYVALKDHVPVAELAKYIADRARVNDDLGYQLTKARLQKDWLTMRLRGSGAEGPRWHVARARLQGRCCSSRSEPRRQSCSLRSCSGRWCLQESSMAA